MAPPPKRPPPKNTKPPKKRPPPSFTKKSTIFSTSKPKLFGPGESMSNSPPPISDVSSSGLPTIKTFYQPPKNAPLRPPGMIDMGSTGSFASDVDIPDDFDFPEAPPPTTSILDVPE